MGVQYGEQNLRMGQIITDVDSGYRNHTDARIIHLQLYQGGDLTLYLVSDALGSGTHF